jgi:hypothetical protein
MDTATILRTYFSGEKSEAALIPLAGVLCLVAAIWLWFWVRQPFARGLALSLLLAALGFTIDYYAEARAIGYVQALEAAGALPRA